mgnify:CR=1 FL=1
MAILLDDAMKNTIRAGVDQAAQPGAAPVPVPLPQDNTEALAMLDKAQWTVISVKLGNELGIFSSTKMTDAATATEAAALANRELDAMIQSANANAQQLGPMAPLVPMIRPAIQINAQGDLLRADLAGPGFHALIGFATQNLVPMLMGGLGGDDAGFPAPPPGFPPPQN